jgi:hypothetical protein
MRAEESRVVQVDPMEQQPVSLRDPLDAAAAERSDRRGELVADDRARLVAHGPPSLPGSIAELHVLEVERREDRIESAQF